MKLYYVNKRKWKQLITDHMIFWEFLQLGGMYIMMTPKERAVTALTLKTPDMVPTF